MFASAADVGRIDALLKRAYKRSFSKDIFTLGKVLKSGSFKNAFPSHCLNLLLPCKKIICFIICGIVTVVTGVFLLCS